MILISAIITSLSLFTTIFVIMQHLDYRKEQTKTVKGLKKRIDSLERQANSQKKGITLLNEVDAAFDWLGTKIK